MSFALIISASFFSEVKIIEIIQYFKRYCIQLVGLESIVQVPGVPGLNIFLLVINGILPDKVKRASGSELPLKHHVDVKCIEVEIVITHIADVVFEISCLGKCIDRKSVV